MGRSGARSRMAGKALLRTGEAFWNQTHYSTGSTQRDYVRQGKVELQSACLSFDVHKPEAGLYPRCTRLHLATC